MTSNMKRVVFASAMGSVFECYDFWVYVMMLPILGPLFFPGGDSVVQTVLSLSAMATTAISRPIGGLIFGYIGDFWGRKTCFLLTLMLMGISAFGMGLLPTYSTVGVNAPIMLVMLRVIQGIALGGEFSGASIYVAEHVRFERRGFFSAMVMLPYGVGVAFTALVIFSLRVFIGEEDFLSWGWRVPFLLSLFVFLISLSVRLSISESPVFEDMVRSRSLSSSPIRDSFLDKDNLRVIFFAFICIMLGESGINQIDYVMFLFLVNVLKVDMSVVNQILMCVYLLHIPVLICVGYLSDKFGRKTILLVAFFLATALYIPGFDYLVKVSYPVYANAIVENPIVIHYRPTTNCEFGVWEHFLLSTNEASLSLTSCQETVRWLGDSVINFSRDGLADREYISVGKQLIGLGNRNALINALTRAGYMQRGSGAGMSLWKMVLCAFLIMIPVSMVFGTCGAALIDLFPPRIRHTSMSFVYNMGHGLLGGLVPVIIMYSVFHFGSIYSIMYYTTLVAFLSLMFGLFFYPKRCYR
ncbi:MFS transporter [Candidatus Ichthyocystis sparus]|uniref:MFS transporter n=1 Tax=Candidatus Ichthyocystis sparus TaxID=1561004 RepID=UPI000AAB96C0|nr:MFS transporter [Candidatus Ichthyocystis sparus]